MNELLILNKDMHKYNTRNKNDINATDINNMTYGSRKLGTEAEIFGIIQYQSLKETATNTFKDKLNQHIICTYQLGLIISVWPRDYLNRGGGILRANIKIVNCAFPSIISLINVTVYRHHYHCHFCRSALHIAICMSF